MSFWSAFSSAQKQQSPPQQEAPPAPTPAVQAAQSKPMSVGHASVAHPQHHEGATDLDLYRTFSPTEVGMWSWEATTGENPAKGSMWSRIFSTNSGTKS